MIQSSPLFSAKLDQFYLQRKVGAMGCLINKVASSSVVRSFLDLDGRNLTHDPLYQRSPHAFKVDLVPTVSQYKLLPVTCWCISRGGS